jgi:hypothetical protein
MEEKFLLEITVKIAILLRTFAENVQFMSRHKNDKNTIVSSLINCILEKVSHSEKINRFKKHKCQKPCGIKAASSSSSSDEQEVHSENYIEK